MLRNYPNLTAALTAVLMFTLPVVIGAGVARMTGNPDKGLLAVFTSVIVCVLVAAWTCDHGKQPKDC